MKKSVLAIVLVVTMLLTCSLSALGAGLGADPEITGSVTAPGFFGGASDTVPLKSGESWSFSFHNKSTVSGPFNNFFLAVTEDPNATDYGNTILLIRADPYGWGDGVHFPDNSEVQAGNGLPFTSDIPEWTSFIAENPDGFEVTVTVSREADTISYSASMGGHTVSASAVSRVSLNETVYLFLTGENCELTNITSSKSGTVAPSKDELTITDFFACASETLPLKSGEGYTITFHNRSTGDSNWHNFILGVSGADGVTDYGQTILLIRADNAGWGDREHYPAFDELETTPLPFWTDITDWLAFVQEAQVGFDVTLTVTRDGDTISYSADMNGHTVSVTAAARTSLPETVYIFLTGENCILSNITFSKFGTETPNKDELTITDFFACASETLPLRSGEGYTITFHNRSTGDSNWHNFILGISGGNGVTDYGQTILLIRGDSFGWGDGDHYPNYDQVNGGDRLPFENNITDWPAFVQEAQAGFDVTLTVTRDGDTISYSADMNGHTVSVTAAARTSLPETVYVFLTGEDCVLSNIASESGATPPPPKEPSIAGDLTVSGFFGAVTDALPLNSGETYTFTFRNQSAGSQNYHNFILGITGGPHANTFAQAILLIRADSYGWGDGVHFPTNEQVMAGDILPFWTDITDWEAFVQEAKAGVDVTVTIARRDNVLFYTAAIGTHSVTLTAFARQPLDQTYVFLSGEDCALTGITTTKADEAPPIPVTPPPSHEEPPTPPAPVNPGTTAVEKLEGNLTVNGFFGAVTNTLPIKSGEGYALKFHSRSTGVTNWENFILALTDAPDTAAFDKSLLILRADSFGWGDGVHFPTIEEVDAGNALPFWTDITDWPAFASEAQEGFDVALTITRDGDTLYYTAEMNGHTVKLTAVSRAPLPETIYAFLTGENCLLTDIGSEGGIKPVPPEEKTVIEGDLTINGFFGAVTNILPIKSGEGYTFTFHNTSNGTLNWENFILALTDAPNTAAFDKSLLILRADSFGWGDGVHFPTIDEVNAGAALPFVTDITDWEAFVQKAQAGFDVALTITRDGDTLYYTAEMSGHTVKLTAVSRVPLPETAYVFLTGENCVLTGISTKSGVKPVPPKEDEPVFLGDLTVNGFFGAVTNTLPIKSGEGYTFTFHTKSNGSSNWENFILAVTDARDATVFDQTILILRADNFGWGDGVHFPTIDEVNETPMPFWTDITDWPAFAAEAKAGFDVTVTVTRSGDTLYYSAKIGSHTVKLTATAKAPLPETAYVFLTGENCSLTGIKGVPISHDNSPKTGDDSQLSLWIAYALVFSMGLVIIGVISAPVVRKK